MSDLKDLRSAKRLQPAFSIVLLACTGTLPGVALAFNISFDYRFDSNNFFDAARKSILDSAAAFFESRITDTLDAIEPGPSGFGFDNTFTAKITNPGTGLAQDVVDLTVPADTLIVFVGGRSLGGSTLGQGGPGAYSASGTQTFIDTVSTRGEPGVDPNGITDTDFAPWGGAITFDNDASTNWYFDNDTTTDEAFTGADFYSVALHEIGHVLGIGTADSWDNKIVNGQFTGAASVAANGGNTIATTADGGHWAANTQSVIAGTNTAQEAAMDPTITLGTRKRFTELDVAGLQDIGWEIQADSAQ